MGNMVPLTYPTLWLVVFASQLCLPVPAIAFLMMAGALVGHGEFRIDLIILVGILGCLAGDLVWFEAGRRWGSRILRLLCSFSSDPGYAAQRARRVFKRWGPRSLLVAKFVPGLDGVTPPLAGMEGIPITSFLAYDAVGSLLWSTFYVGVGYVFADRLNVAITYVTRFGHLLAVAIGVPLILYAAWRAITLIRMIHKLRLRKISPSLLRQRLDADENIALVDLVSFDETEPFPGIPGAIRVDPQRLRVPGHVKVPKDLDVVLYCSSARELTSARVALALRRKGVARVWVLEGGLTAWKKLGFPVEPIPASNRAAIERLGIRVLDNHNHPLPEYNGD
ncbi:VTT domain-containing protein [Granulicella sp. L60]|uniref:VTT domain-containing protein n=1 Tax=Granulicella sp. L60 TaxID=1641866 RepID=UPI00352AF6BF